LTLFKKQINVRSVETDSSQINIYELHTFDGPARNFIAFTFTRPVADILIGIMTIRQKWEMHLGSTTTLTEEYLSDKYPMVELEENVMIFFSQCCLVEMISNLEPNQVIFRGEDVVVFILMKIRKKWILIPMKLLSIMRTATVMNTWDIFSKNDAAIREDLNF
jgi:hypothetical protein